jgi:hypothetical protein
VHQLDALLAQRFANRRVRALNGGVPGFGPPQELLLLRRLLPGVQPDAVLLAVFVGNDFGEIAAKIDRSFTVWDGELVRKDALLSGGVRWRTLLERSHLFQLLCRASALARAASEPELAREREGKYLWQEYHRLQLFYADPKFDSWWRFFLVAMREQLGAFLACTREHQVPLCVALLPDVVQVDPTVLESITALFPRARGQNLDFERPNRELVRALAELGVPAIDLLPALRERGRAAPLYLPRDWHLNAVGNQIVAEELMRALAPRLEEWLAGR